MAGLHSVQPMVATAVARMADDGVGEGGDGGESHQGKHEEAGREVVHGERS